MPALPFSPCAASPAVSDAPPAKPLMLGRYQVLKRIAVGGMAEVFLARATGIEGFQREVVVKRILPELAQDAAFVAAFLSEARLTAQLVHPHIAQVFDLGQAGDSYFLAMEYVRGYDLGLITSFERERGSRVPLPIALRIMIDVCEGLDYAHEAHDLDGRNLQLVHRDVTPSNVLVSLDGMAKVVDFGIAKAARTEAGERRTVTGTVKGKLSYMAPEQVLGRYVDRRADVFAVGVILYELLTGSNPFRRASSYETLRSVVELEPPPASQLGAPAGLDALTRRVLSKDPQGRYSTVAELLHDLEDAAGAAFIPLSHGEVARYLRGDAEARALLAEKTLGGGGDLTVRRNRQKIAVPSRRPVAAVAVVIALGLVLGAASLLLRGDGLRGETALPPSPLSALPPPEAAKLDDVAMCTSPATGAEVKQAPPPQTRGRAEPRSAAVATQPAPTVARKGKLRVVTTPDGADVIIDGEQRGETPFFPVELSAGSHVVVVHHPDMRQRQQRIVDIQPNKELLLEVDFTR